MVAPNDAELVSLAKRLIANATVEKYDPSKPFPEEMKGRIVLDGTPYQLQYSLDVLPANKVGKHLSISRLDVMAEIDEGIQSRIKRNFFRSDEKILKIPGLINRAVIHMIVVSEDDSHEKEKV